MSIKFIFDYTVCLKIHDAIVGYVTCNTSWFDYAAVLSRIPTYIWVIWYLSWSLDEINYLFATAQEEQVLYT